MLSRTQPGTPTISEKKLKKVLIVDDDPLISQSIRHLLKRMDIESRVASQWAEAMDALERERPDLILLDMRMPNVDGPTLLEFVREQGYDTPVVVVSASLGEVDLDHLRELGVRRFVPKPFSIEQLRGIIEEQLKSSPQQTDPTNPAGQTGPAGLTEIADLEETPAPVSLSHAKPSRGGHLTPRAGLKRARKQQLIVIAVICASVSLLLLGAKLFISNSGIMTYISDQLIHQSEMKH